MIDRFNYLYDSLSNIRSYIYIKSVVSACECKRISMQFNSFCLITKIDLQHDNGQLPHQQNDARDEIERRLNREVKTLSKYYL